VQVLVDEELEDLRDYAQRLVESLPDSGADGDADGNREGAELMVSPGTRAPLISPEYERKQEMLGAGTVAESGQHTGCREAVEILTRISKKGVFLVN
jgi:hypothetical protein